MSSKTSQFNVAIEEILNALKPHSRICKQCGGDFKILQEDINFYKKIKVPPPKLCSECRKQRRMAFANYSTFYKRKCDAPDHSEILVSVYPSTSPAKFYDFDYWWSDAWGGKEFARNYNPAESVLKQIGDLIIEAPHVVLTRDPKSINSEYTSTGSYLKNSYYTFGCLRSENIYYGVWVWTSKDSIDVFADVSLEHREFIARVAITLK